MVEHEKRGELRDNLSECLKDFLTELCYILDLKRSGNMNEKIDRILRSEYDFQYVLIKMNYLGLGLKSIDFFSNSELSDIITEHNLDKQSRKWDKMVEIIKNESLSPLKLLGLITTEQLHDLYYNLFDEDTDLDRDELIRDIIDRYNLHSLEEEKNLGFIMMPMSNYLNLEKTYQIIKKEAGNFNINAVRIDEIESSNKITDEILEMIESSKYLFVDLTLERPNVYYELGYSHGSKKNPKKIVLLAKKGTRLHFDIRNMRTIFYSNTRDLRNKLRKRLEDIVE